MQETTLRHFGKITIVETIITLYDKGIIPWKDSRRESIKEALLHFFDDHDADYWLDYYQVK